MKKHFLPKTEDGLRNWLRNLATKIGGYSAQLEQQVQQLTTDRDTLQRMVEILKPK